MASSYSLVFLHVLVIFSLARIAFSDLSDDFYDDICPQALPTINRVVEDAIRQERRMGASLLRLHFHDCFVNLHGPTWEVELGRRDSTTASRTTADNDIPTPLMDLPALIDNFKKQGLDEEDLVALSGGHTLGFAQCSTFRNRIYDETNNIDSTFASQRQANCPRSGGDSNLASLDPTPALFDSKYFSNLVSKKGLLHSDQALFSGGETDELVKTYSTNLRTFSKDFSESMIKMGNIKPLTGNEGQIRVDCRKVN
uniref:Peroxidase 2 n=2 Tax=Solanum tuberosum TaxID=4113 RepID=M1A8L3_SOLTU